jgi:hypothetical protein
MFHNFPDDEGDMQNAKEPCWMFYKDGPLLDKLSPE